MDDENRRWKIRSRAAILFAVSMVRDADYPHLVVELVDRAIFFFFSCWIEFE